MTFQAWIKRGRELGASDVHLEAGTAPVARVRGELLGIGETVPATQMEEVARSLLSEEGWDGFVARGSADLSVAISGVRCRINLYHTVRGIAVAVRLLSAAAGGLRACNLHPQLGKLIEATSGLVVISGPTGSGKSTTQAALIEELNASRARNIVTLESPLEYVFTNRRSFIRQREIPTHSPSFEQAIVDALRENPDVLVIGEMRTPEVMRLTLNAAETGHLVLATLHSATCAEALTRICMSFPAEIQGSIRAQLADCLVGVVCQRLDFLEAYQLRVPRCEILVANIAAKGTLRSGALSQIPNVIQAGAEDGMWSFDRYRRWMEQKKDWVMPAAAPLAPATMSASAPAGSRRTASASSSASTPATSRRSAPASAPESAPTSVTSRRPVETSIEEHPDDADLAELAQLAKEIEQRSS